MILILEQWKEILNSNEGDILEAIKNELEEKYQAVCQEWKEKDFNVDHLFDVSFTIFDNLKLTLLHIAAYNGHLEIVKHLIEKGAKVNSVNEGGYTPLHFAIEENRLDIVKYLVDKGANRYIKNGFNETPIDLAEAETKQIISKAIKTGATLSIITALTIGVGCGIAGIGLPILVIASIAVSAALVIGAIAGGITYSVLKPSDKLDKPDLEIASQQVPEKAC